MELRDYQQDLLDTFKTHRFVLVKHSRQMGVTTTIIEHIIHLLLDDKKHTIIFFTLNSTIGKEILNKIRTDNRVSGVGFVNQKTNVLVLNNGNKVKLGITSDSFRGDNFTDFILDNGCFINNLKQLIQIAQVNLASQKYSSIIISSSNKKGVSDFNELFNDTKNIFKKQLIHWSSNKELDNEWSDKIKKQMSEADFKCEYDLLDTPQEEKNNKDRLISFRLNDEIYNKLSEKLIQRDMSLSEYLRFLITND